MVTKLQAMVAQRFHQGDCNSIHNPATGRLYHNPIVWRRNGMTKTWKKDPARFQVPVKHGLRDYGYISESNADQFHTEQSCPFTQKG